MSDSFKNKDSFKKAYIAKVEELSARDFKDTYPEQQYLALGYMIRDYAVKNWRKTKNTVKQQQAKQLYYFSMEFLMGRLMTSNLMNLGCYDVVKEGLADLGIDINDMENRESDAGLGNGGLGRLAACFLDSLASLDLPGHGNCIRYHYGLFKQKIENNQQVELPDCWMQNGNVWETWKPHHAVRVKFGGSIDAWMDQYGKFHQTYNPSFVVKAVPYEEPIIGYHTPTTNTLRLWDTEVDEETVQAGKLNKYLDDVTSITANVYPDDSTEKGKELRLKQEYFFVCAGVDYIIRDHLRTYESLDNLGDKVAIQLNDTHPVLVIPELMRVLMDDYNYEWDDAWNIVKKTCAYTNHTVMAEALEKWNQDMVRNLLPRVYMIIEEIDRRWRSYVENLGHYNTANRVAVLQQGQVHMAHLAIVGSHSINGVAALHSQILIEDVLHDFAQIYPDRFNNKTNGITHRRWLMYSNPQLTSLLEKTIGDDFKKHPEKLEDLMAYVDDVNVQKQFMAVKMQRKQILVDYVKKNLGIDVDVNSIFDCQAKRLHAYKRQLLNIFGVMHCYLRMKQDPNYRIYPRTFFFSAKAAPGYALAKEIIKLINMVANKVNNDPETNQYLKVVFIPNYSVSVAEILLNAADVSEQISTAGKEASGTGNMKYMMNGALTLGTLDGANVEIVDRVGFDNAEIFGYRVEDINQMKHDNSYNAWNVYNSDARVRMVIESLRSGMWSSNKDEFRLIYNDLMLRNDEFFVLGDFAAYLDAQNKVEQRYRNQSWWARTMLINIAKSGYFSSDRTIAEYAKEIWDLKPIQY